MKMKKSWVTIIVIAVIALFFYSSIKGNYNKMVAMDEGVKSQWAQVENVYQRRADLIPNLVNTVKGYAEHEKETLTEVVEARAKATSTTIDPTNLNAENIQAFQQAQSGLSSALSKLMVVVERYPDLKANQNFLELQAQLEGTENRITVERQNLTIVHKLLIPSLNNSRKIFMPICLALKKKPISKHKKMQVKHLK